MADLRLDGEVALVTGAGSPIGMGRVIALAMLRAGARVAMLDVLVSTPVSRVGTPLRLRDR